MRLYVMQEMPYTKVPVQVERELDSSHVIVPSRYCRPEVAADLYDVYLDELAYADELGLDVAISEHHQSITTLIPNTSIIAAVLTQITKRARIAIVGVPLPVRDNPVQVVEDLAMLDCLSRGRMILGMVRGVSTEMHPHNVNAGTTADRMQEAHDLIMEAWRSSQPFSWEGTFADYRYVNAWPRPYQHPHPPIWWTGTSLEHVYWAADHRHSYGVFMMPYERAKGLFDAYRQRWRENGWGEAPADKLAYLGMGLVGNTDEQAYEDSKEFDWYLGLRKRNLGFHAVPGFRDPKTLATATVAMYDPELRNNLRAGSWSSAIAAGTLMTGNPDTMIEKITAVHEMLGIGHYLMMYRTGEMPTAKVRRSMELLANEVYPAVRHLGETR